jgi:hypothetical protein
VKGFDYKAMAWAELPAADTEEMVALVPAATETLETDTLSPVA